MHHLWILIIAVVVGGFPSQHLGVDGLWIVGWLAGTALAYSSGYGGQEHDEAKLDRRASGQDGVSAAQGAFS